MAPNKDARRPDLVVPYQEPKSSSDTTDFSSTMSTTLPMAAMFTRNKMVGCDAIEDEAMRSDDGYTVRMLTICEMNRAAVVFSIQSWLGESEDSKKNSTTPGYFSVGMSIMALAVTYLPMFLPPPGGRQASGTEPPAPVPLA
ncbi:hypothetical protein FALBO_7327 [Fusarium albosuccineum]|uniref:Uncharacterized protein n=1 Tax=Fusarium albosuccineum TaxID=1237068 RepID=A0A8H4P813_9HYPO|nr:hypothetical protein FALBO_7327 [Fusarium albosuccineum]